MKIGPDSGQTAAERTGVIAALGAYIFWGVAPIYFKLIQTVPPLEVITHRIFWSIPLLAGFLLLRDGTAFWKRVRLPMRTILTLLLSGTVLAVNWLVYVWAISHDQILATSLGYFIGPLVNFLLGFLFLKERLSRIQGLGVLIAAAGTIYLAWFLGVPPWIALLLAFTFGFYGLIRKKLDVGPMIGLLWEAVLLVPPAVVFIAWSMDRGTLSFGGGEIGMDVLLALSGLVTILPLIAFNLAARTLSLTALGFLQYLAPIISFSIAVFLFHEPFTQGHAVAFGSIWFALILVSAESLTRMRRRRAV